MFTNVIVIIIVIIIAVKFCVYTLVIMGERDSGFCLLLQYVLPELTAHLGVTLLLLITSHWFLFLLNTPFAGWLLYRYGLQFINI